MFSTISQGIGGIPGIDGLTGDKGDKVRSKLIQLWFYLNLDTVYQNLKYEISICIFFKKAFTDCVHEITSGFDGVFIFYQSFPTVQTVSTSLINRI